ncbi:hypothetical protein EDD76_101270 [Kineothrix alysoides]|uniref:Uncharacterized protein n=1 Tax=Kineothrix alysoides TaxID=1469948 RepID=A0A4R1R6H4_9FIRM|nr:hypothetical protein EDD76_101270 [Kineothrix alysoides]
MFRIVANGIMAGILRNTGFFVDNAACYEERVRDKGGQWKVTVKSKKIAIKVINIKKLR